MLLQQPVTNLPLQQPSVANVPLQQPLQKLARSTAPLQPAAPQLPLPHIIVRPPPPQRTSEAQKCLHEAIPEDDEPIKPRQQRYVDILPPVPKDSPPVGPQQLEARVIRPARRKLR
jgi:hypothetical protein